MCKLFIISENEMGGLRGLGRLGGLGRVKQVGLVRRVGVRAAPAIVRQMEQVEGEQKGRLLDVCSLLIVC